MTVLLASDYDKSRFLKSEDIGDRERKFRIKDATEEEVGEKKEKKLVVWFTNEERGLILNKTNNRVLRGAFGDNTALWRGKIIVIFVIMVDNRGKMVPGLRVRIPPPKQSAATAEPPQQPVKSGNGAAAPSPTSGNGAAATPAAAAPAASAVHDPELEPDPVKPIKEEVDDEIPW
jgi:hypothetical protein